MGFLLSRVVQGMGYAMINVSVLAILINESPDLMKDVSQQETLVGIGNIICPAIAGIIYTYMGFSAVFLFLAGGYILLMTTMVFLASLGLIAFRNSAVTPPTNLPRPSNAAPPLPSSLPSPKPTPPPPPAHSTSGLSRSAAWLLSVPRGVWFSAAAVSSTYASMSFLDMSFAPHVYSALGVEVIGAGFMFSK